MKRMIFVLLAMALLMSMVAGCASNAKKEVGPALLTISGKIGEKNSGDKFVVDQAYFDANSVEIKMDDPWMGDGIAYKGVLVRNLAKDLKLPGDAAILKVIATDGKGIDLSMADIEKWDIMLAHWADGKELDNETGGPVKIVFPADERGSYADDQWMWWLTTAEIK